LLRSYGERPETPATFLPHLRIGSVDYARPVSEIRSMMGGTLDDRTRIQPTFSIWCSSGQPWLKLPDSIACYPEYPEGTFGG